MYILLNIRNMSKIIYMCIYILCLFDFYRNPLRSVLIIFADEETRPQRDELTCLRSTN